MGGEVRSCDDVVMGPMKEAGMAASVRKDDLETGWKWRGSNAEVRRSVA